MRWLRTCGRWLADWRNGATVVASVLVALLAVTVIDARAGRQDALHALEAQSEQAIDSRAAATRRISMLLDEVAVLREGQASTALLIGELTGQINALRSQVEQLGGEPVAGERPTSPPAARSTAPDPPVPTPPSDPEPDQPPQPEPAPDQPPQPKPEPDGPGEPDPGCTVPIVCSLIGDP